MENQGWIKLHRRLLENTIFTSEKGLKIWVWCLLKANHQDQDVFSGRQRVHISAGQFIMGRNTAKEELKMAVGTIWFWLDLLEKDKYIERKSTNKYSIVTVLNYDKYQETERRLNADRTQIVQQIEPNKNDKNEKNDKNSTKVEGGVTPTSTTPSLKGDVFAPKYGNKDINLILGALSRLNTTGKLDSSNAENRKHAQNLLKKYGKDEILRVIKALPTVPFWSGKVTSAGLLLRHFNAIINSLPKKQEYKFL